MSTQPSRRGPIRDVLEALGMAVMMAVLLKYFAIEAYVIPTPSMQPTMMGAPEAGQRDRILVDKSYYTISDPKRWDIAVFRYPLRQMQSYVKRTVGLPEDHLFILGGNIYTQQDGKKMVQRKPEPVQRSLWRQVYPMRRELEKLEGEDTSTLLRNYFYGVGWKEDGDSLTVKDPRGAGGELRFNGKNRQMLANRLHDGYSPNVALEIKKAFADRKSREAGSFGVTDARVQLDLTPQQSPARAAILLATGSSLLFGLEISDGKGRLIAGKQKGRSKFDKLATSEPFDFALPGGETVRLGFARLDDELIAYRNGDELARFDVTAHPVFDDLKPQEVQARLALEAKGEVRVDNVVIERDLYYTRSGEDISKQAGIKVPAGHYFMMGDNTLSSEDSRAWRSVTIGVDAENNIVDPKSPDCVRTLVGNNRSFPLDRQPDADENPVPAHANDGKTAVVGFTDRLGQVHRLYGEIDPALWGRATLKDDPMTADPSLSTSFVISANGSTAPLRSKVQQVHFVPREHFQGRPVLNFFRSFWDWGYNRWIR